MSEVKTLDDLEQIEFDVDQYTPLFEAYNEDLNRYVNTFTSSKQTNGIAAEFLLNKLVDKWQPALGFNMSTITRHIREIQTPKTNFQSSLTLKEALDKYQPGGSWLIPNLLRKVGLYVFIGEPKAGKSLLMYSLAYSLTVTQNFLGKTTKAGRVLYLQLEEPEETFSERLFRAGFGDLTDTETSVLVNCADVVRIERTFDITRDISWLINLILEYKPVAVIIDSLRKAAKNSGYSENSNEMGSLVYTLQDVFTFTGTCGILIHHMNKTGGRQASSISIFDRSSGHGSIIAAGDGAIAISKRNPDDDKIITLQTLPRNGIAITLEYKVVTDERGLIKIEKLSENTPADSVETAKILRCLGRIPDNYFSIKEIANELNVPLQHKGFKDALEYLQSSQIIATTYRNKSFRYALASNSMWLVNPESLSDGIRTPEILDANAIMVCETKRQLRDTLISWDKARRDAAYKCILATEIVRLEQLMRSWEFAVGDKVMYGEEEVVIQARLDENNSTFLNNKYELVDYEGYVLEQDLTPIINVIEDDLEFESFDVEEDLFPVQQEESTAQKVKANENQQEDIDDDSVENEEDNEEENEYNYFDTDFFLDEE